MAGHSRETDFAKRLIPVAKPFFTEAEVKAAGEVISSGWVAQGPKVREFEEAFRAYVGADHACAVANATAALHTALLAAGVNPGNIVLTVSHSFIATANCVRYCGGEPVFVDIDSETFNMSAQGLSECLQRDCETRSGRLYYKNAAGLAVGASPLVHLKPGPEFGRVAAVLAVHQMGMPCDLRSIIPLARKFHLPLIEDAACAAGSEILMEDGGRWEKLGRPHGDMACFSFHPRKILSTGEGGMITAQRAEYDRRCRRLRHQGMTISNAQRHESKEVMVEAYPEMGFNYRLTDIQAAIGIEQMKKMPALIARRRALAAVYLKELAQIPWLAVTKEPPFCRSNWQSFPVRLLEGAPMDQTAFMQYLLDNGVATRPGIMNAHEEKPFAAARRPLKHSETARRSAVILPLFHTMEENDIGYIVNLIKHA